MRAQRTKSRPPRPHAPCCGHIVLQRPMIVFGTQVRLQSAKSGHLGSINIVMLNGTQVSVTAWWIDFDGHEVRRLTNA